MAITRTKKEEIVTVHTDGNSVRVAVKAVEGMTSRTITTDEAKQLRKELKVAIRSAEARGF